MPAARTFPDPHAAKEEVWLKFLREDLKCDADTVLVGHSSGAVACMRLLESTELAGAVLVSACHTDLGDAGERAAGCESAAAPALLLRTAVMDQGVCGTVVGDASSLLPLHWFSR